MIERITTPSGFGLCILDAGGSVLARWAPYRSPESGRWAACTAKRADTRRQDVKALDAGGYGSGGPIPILIVRVA